MKKYQKEIIKLTAMEVLMTVSDLATPFFQAHSLYRVSTRKYLAQREDERLEFMERIRYLRRQGLIENFVEGKDKFVEISTKGIEKLSQYKMDNPIIQRPEIWDSKWRVVIFDIPKKHSSDRDVLRNRLIKLGFQKVQESVYVYPFECTEVIENISSRLSILQYVLIMVSEIIQGEDQIIRRFLDAGILGKNDLRN